MKFLKMPKFDLVFTIDSRRGKGVEVVVMTVAAPSFKLANISGVNYEFQKNAEQDEAVWKFVCAGNCGDFDDLLNQ